MAYVIKPLSKAYYKRYQTKFRRRREGKTDYRARKRLVVQAKDKYNSPRFRFVVRFSNQFVTCQVVSATMAGDEVLCSAHSSELGKYGVVAGLKNYAAAYCTGLLCARRLLTNIKFTDEDGDEQVLSDLYEPAPCDGRVRSVRYGRRTLYVEDLEWETERRPFRCNLDVGVKATTLGSRLFGALKGASDGGLDIPHSHKRFPGYSPEKKKYNAGAHLDRIYGVHVANYMRKLQKDDAAKYAEHFSLYIKAGKGPDAIKGMYEEAHAAILKDASRAPVPAEKKHAHLKAKHPLQVKLSKAQRDQRVANKKVYKAYKVWKDDQDDGDDDDEESGSGSGSGSSSDEE